MVARIKKEVSGGNYFVRPNSTRSFISSGSKLLDLALGGGWAEGRIANIKGDKSVGKTLLMIEAAANFALKYPKGGKNIKYREAEAAFDVAYAESQGLPTKHVDFGEYDLRTVEDFYDDLADVARQAEAPTLYILDSLDSLSDEAELDRDIRKGSFGGGKAKKMSEAFRRLIRDVSKHMTVLIVSQIRDNVGVVYGPKTTRAGGKAMDFYASQVLFLKQLKTITATHRGVTRPVGVRVLGKVEKNKIALPGREAEFKIMFGYGIDDVEACLEWLQVIKRLRELGTSSEKGAIAKYLDKLDVMKDDQYRDEVKHLHGVIEQHWYEIEECFVPPRRKYL
jgi:recombination protein RecA